MVARDRTHKGKLLSAPIDLELYMALEHYAAANGISVSQAARNLLRYALGTAPNIERGWYEGYQAACNAVKHAVEEAITAVGVGPGPPR